MPIKTYLLIFLFELGWGIKFNIVGEISISELFLLVYTPFIIAKIRWQKTKELKAITLAYSALLAAQIFSEVLVSNGLSSSLKGLAITVVSYLHFIFLFYYLTKDKRLILVVILSQIAMKLIFGTSFEDQSAEDILAGEAATYLKFYIAPLTILIFLAISVIYNNRNFPVLFSLLGIVFILLGARSSGGMALFAGAVAYLMEHQKMIPNKKTLIIVSILLLAVSYGLYTYYVNLVLSGEITSGNSQQLFICKNPYNPIELLMAGRSEVWVGWQAFMDKFWLGNGSWALDTTGRYQKMMAEIHGERLAVRSFNYAIPAHSVLIAMGMKNGIMAFLVFSFILTFFLKKGFLALKKCDNRYVLVLSYYIFSCFWNALFSPSSHFRLTLPISFAIILVLYAIKYSNRKSY